MVFIQLKWFLSCLNVLQMDERMEETEGGPGIALGSPDNGSLICLTMDTGQDQENNCEPLHTSLVTIPQISSDQTGSLKFCYSH